MSNTEFQITTCTLGGQYLAYLLYSNYCSKETGTKPRQGQPYQIFGYAE